MHGGPIGCNVADHDRNQFGAVKESRVLLLCWVLVAHACNPSYSGDKDQKDCDVKLAQENSSQDPISKKPITQKVE
jgi:hypothetical protein